MKKTLFVLLFVGITCYGQTEKSFLEPDSKNRTEVKVNALSIALGAIDLEFERTINQNSSIGLAFVTKVFEYDGFNFFDYDNSISGFYRYFLGKKYASGLFLEGYGMLQIEQDFLNRRRGDFLLGVGAGYKHVFDNGIVLQGNLGVGRNLTSNGGEKYLGKLGFTIGYSF